MHESTRTGHTFRASESYREFAAQLPDAELDVLLTHLSETPGDYSNQLRWSVIDESAYRAWLRGRRLTY